MKTKTLGLLILAIVVGVAAGLAVMSRSSSDALSAPYTGQIIPASEFAVADYAGKPLALNFFFRNCPACGAEAADLKAFAEANPGVQVVAVDVKDGEDDATAFLQEHGLQVPLVIDDGTLGSEYGIEYTPTTVFLDAKGEEVDRLIGASTLDQFTASLAKTQ